MSGYWYTDAYGRKRHVDDGDSYGSTRSHTASLRYERIKSNFSEFDFTYNNNYLAPTNCPVCDDEVYFCQCANGGRVFFDTLYPTWKKHPCTISNTSTSKVYRKYSIILPTQNIIQDDALVKRKTQFGKPNSKHGFELNTTNELLYKNITQNVSLLVHYAKQKFFITVIITNGKFSGHYVCRNKMFNNLHDLKDYLIHILSNVDLAISIDVERVKETIDSEGNKVILVNSYQINQMREKGKKRRSKEAYEKKKIKFEKQNKTKKQNKKQSSKKKATIESLAHKGWVIK